MTGLSQSARLEALAGRLSERDRAVVADAVRLRFVTAGQLSRLHFAAIPQPVTRVRRVQRTLGRLVEHGLLIRCTRRVGGVRAGSASFTYSASAEGIRLVGYFDGQGIPRARAVQEPGTSFVDHSVACCEVYVRAIEAERTGRLELLTHQAEPDCWRWYLGAIGVRLSLRPDAFVALGVGDFEQRSFVEIDRGTEGTTALRRKLSAYLDYWRSGAEQQEHGVFPRVVWQVGTNKRATVLRALIDELPAASRPLFSVTRSPGVLAHLCGAGSHQGGDS
ncbi:MAG: replication-relaxation family protein [Solirubrobacteraceae bacterium]